LSRFKIVLLSIAAASFAYAADDPLRIPEAAAKKAAIENPAPEYPLVARQLKVSGTVNLEARVTAEGTVESVQVLSGTPILTKPAAEALRKWKFRPFTKEGKPASAIVTLSFEFATQ
jgi:protein TonB